MDVYLYIYIFTYIIIIKLALDWLESCKKMLPEKDLANLRLLQDFEGSPRYIYMSNIFMYVCIYIYIFICIF
jgi:hypothetical protein